MKNHGAHKKKRVESFGELAMSKRLNRERSPQIGFCFLESLKALSGGQDRKGDSAPTQWEVHQVRHGKKTGRKLFPSRKIFVLSGRKVEL